MKNTVVARKDVPIETEQTATGIFYGWIIVGCAFTILWIAYGIQFSFGVFLPYISADTGWTRGSLSIPYSLYVFVYCALGMVAGRLTDRLGPKIVLIVGGVTLGIGVAITSHVHALWQLYLSLGVIAAIGMSAAYVPCNATIVRWFAAKRAIAVSVASGGSSFGMFTFPPLVTALIRLYGWRNAYLILSIVALALIVTCASFVVRDPEQMGLHPDGASIDPAPLSPLSSPTPVSFENEWSLSDARRTSAFWLLTAIFTLTWLVIFMPLVHLVPFAEDLGISHYRAAMTISVIGFAGFAGRVAIGPISDRIGRRQTLALCLVFQALSFIGFTFSHGLNLLYTAAGIFGFSYGGLTALFPALIGDFFGRVAIGAIVGFIFAIAGSPSAFGPLVAGAIYTATKSYRLAFELGAVVNLGALSMVAFLRRPERTA
ncbi:MAG TPA: MFS transporter [Candidatus Binataceae bacterium]|nr:MFS transporter [Candidatus Binataceae bacterium]